MVDFEDTVIDGNSIRVEIDECKLSKQKYNRGHRVDCRWAMGRRLGGVEDTPERRAFFLFFLFQLKIGIQIPYLVGYYLRARTKWI